MLKVATSMRSTVFVNRFFFSKDLYINGANPIRERVMSTPSWPVPYYQRVTKAYPIRGTSLLIQNSRNQIWEELMSQPAISLGSKQSRSSMQVLKAGRLSATPSKTSIQTVKVLLLSLSDQEGRL